jgi:MFS-type transporter involved in bile tolerance (Atg22 family)
MVRVQEPPATPLAPGREGSPWRDSFVRLGRTLTEIRRYRELFKMLIAFWLYMEGIGAIILLAAAYGAALGLDTAVLIGTLLMTQFVAFPYSIAYGYVPDPAKRHRGAVVSMILWTGATFPCMGAYANLHGGLSVPAVFGLMAANQAAGVLFSALIGKRLFAGLTRRINAKRAVILGLLIYCIVPIWGYYLHTRAEFFMLGWLVGSLQGGTQALSRSIYASLTPASKSGEFFGLYGLSEKFAGVLGPLLYGIVGQITHNPRDSILSITLFFILGIVMLGRVDVEKGSMIAEREDEVLGLPNAP